MNKNEKKKNAIRFGAFAIAILIFGGVFSVWALSTQATATAGVGSISVDGLTVYSGADANTTGDLLEDSVAGRPGTVNASDADPFELYTFGEDSDGALENTNYTAMVYLVNGADLIDAGMRYLTLDMNLTASGTVVDNGTLTLENGRAAFTFNATNHQPSDDLTVDIVGGSYGSHPFADFSDLNQVEFMIDVEPGQPA